MVDHEILDQTLFRLAKLAIRLLQTEEFVVHIDNENLLAPRKHDLHSHIVALLELPNTQRHETQLASRLVHHREDLLVDRAVKWKHYYLQHLLIHYHDKSLFHFDSLRTVFIGKVGLLLLIG